MMLLPPKLSKGFTLIELSIVLVIIGLIIGGILVGRSLIGAAEIRSQISQVEKLNAAVHTFRLKYNGIPGDLRNASSFGFADRSGAAGSGDGNGKVEYCSPNSYGGYIWENFASLVLGCENALFWRDLSDSKLIPNSFTTATDAAAIFETGPELYLPGAKIGNQNFLVASSMCPNNQNLCFWILKVGASLDGGGYYNGTIVANTDGETEGLLGMTPDQVRLIDVKMDDGLPQSGLARLPLQAYDFTFLTKAANGCLLGTTPLTYKSGDTPNVCSLAINAQ